MNVYCVWQMAEAYEGADWCVGIYSDLDKAELALSQYREEKGESEAYTYITKVELNCNAFNNVADAVGVIQ